MDIIDNILNALQGLLQLGGQDNLWLPMTLVFATVILFSVFACLFIIHSCEKSL